MEKKIRVCWYCEKWQPGGIQAVQVNLLQYMDLNRIHMDIVVSEDDTTLFDERLCSLGVRKIVTLEKKIHDPGKRVLANIFAFGKLLGQNRYDVIHLNVCHGVELIYSFLAWYHHVPVRIVHCRNNDIGAGGRSRKLKILCHNICKRIFKGCATVKLANSDLAAEWLYTKRDIESGSVKIIRNGINADRYIYDPQIRKEIRCDLNIENKFVVGHVGHFSYQKNHEFLLTIFKEIYRRNSSAVLLLVGEGDEKEKIADLAQKYGLADRVIFYGVTNDVPELMMAMDVFVFPSRFEGFGNVLIEAQACGLKCFASDTVIPKSVEITENMSWISLNDSPGKWAEKIIALGSDYDRKSHVKEVKKNGYAISNMAKSLEKIYESVICSSFS